MDDGRVQIPKEYFDASSHLDLTMKSESYDRLSCEGQESEVNGVESDIAVGSEKSEIGSDFSQELSFNLAGYIKKRPGRRADFTGLNQRKDVVLKSLLRKIKKFFWTHFKHLFKYIQLKKADQPAIFESYLRAYVEVILKQEATPEYVFTFGSFINPKEMKRAINYNFNMDFEFTLQKIERLSRIEEIYDILYRFSISKFKRYAKKKIIRGLINHYIRVQSEFSQDEKIGLQIILDK